MSQELTDLMRNARTSLERAGRLIADQIGSYPTPVSGCDAQFNHLLEERHRISAARAALDQDVFIPTPRSPTPFAGVESR
jgi:hypothetical protein